MSAIIDKAVEAAPERVWMGCDDGYAHHDFWFEPDEGGVEYVRADLVPHIPASLPGAVKEALIAKAREIGFLSVEDIEQVFATPPVPGEPQVWPDIGIDPMRGPREDYTLENAMARVREAYVIQQKEVPDQTALVWRTDIGKMLMELVRLLAWQDMQRAKTTPQPYPAPAPAEQAPNVAVPDEVVDVLRWYAEQVAGCRRIGSGGDAFRQALDRDGGERANSALRARAEQREAPAPAETDGGGL